MASKNKIAEDYVNEQMAKFYEKLGISDRNRVDSIERRSQPKSSSDSLKENISASNDAIASSHELNNQPKIQLSNHLLLFNGCSDNNNLVIFKDINVQSQHGKLLRKRAALSTQKSSNNKSLIDFKEFMAMDLYKRSIEAKKEFSYHDINFDIQINVKIGYKYFESKLFRWNQLITIQELSDLLEKNKISLSNSKYYHKPKYEFMSQDTLRSKYSDHAGIEDAVHFIKYLTSNGFSRDYELTTYRVIGVKKQLVDKLLAEARVDADLCDLMQHAKDVTLKFYNNFKLKQIEIYNCNNSNIDVISDEFDIRIQSKTMHYLNKEVCKRFEQFEEAFSGFISDVNDPLITINCDPKEVNFLKKTSTTNYIEESDAIRKPMFGLKLINFVEYLPFSSRKGCVLMEPRGEITNHARIKTSIGELLNTCSSMETVESFKEENLNNFYEELYHKSVWLSNIASKFKF
jgi:hypothetical protein